MKTQNKSTQVTIFKYRTALFLACQARSENLNDSHHLWTRVIKEAEEIVSTMPIEVIEAVDRLAMAGTTCVDLTSYS